MQRPPPRSEVWESRGVKEGPGDRALFQYWGSSFGLDGAGSRSRGHLGPRGAEVQRTGRSCEVQEVVRVAGAVDRQPLERSGETEHGYERKYDTQGQVDALG